MCNLCNLCSFLLDEQILHETSVVPEHNASLSATLTSDFHMGEVGF